MKTKVKKKIHKTSDPNYDVHTYGQGKNPFDIEWIKYYNAVEGRDQIIFLYMDKKTKKIYKHKILQ
jgi:hypothetical protein